MDEWNKLKWNNAFSALIFGFMNQWKRKIREILKWKHAMNTHEINEFVTFINHNS